MKRALDKLSIYIYKVNEKILNIKVIIYYIPERMILTYY